MNDGPVILINGDPMTPEQIVKRLNKYDESLKTAKQAWAEHYKETWGIDIYSDDGLEPTSYAGCV